MWLLLIPVTRGFLFAGEQERRSAAANALSFAVSRITFHALLHRRE
jgi:hypothetical protein